MFLRGIAEDLCTNEHAGFKTSALWGLIDGVSFNLGRKDTISWKFTSSGKYSVATTYMAYFAGLVLSNTAAITWKTWAPPKCKFFVWLILQNRVWTATGCIGEGGQIVACAPFASRPRRLPHISSFSVDSPLEFGMKLSASSACMAIRRWLGTMKTLSVIGGSIRWRLEDTSKRPLPR